MKRRDFFNRLASIAAAPVVAKYATLEPQAKPKIDSSRWEPPAYWAKTWNADNWLAYGAARTYSDGPFPRLWAGYGIKK